MIKKLIKHGNSTAIILDKPILNILNISNDTELKISTDGVSIIITPVNENGSAKNIINNQAVQKAFEEIMKQYWPVFKKLAKN
jgi:antitoxin component of MazEF toxin-antitoxin module